jgi:hypothetical protein
MEHSEAVASKASVRYLLGEMTEQDRADYEEHAFACSECAQDLRAGAAFIDNARDSLGRVSERQPGVAARRWWVGFFRPAFALPVVALLLAIVGYQNGYVLPRLKSQMAQATAPQTLPALSLLGADTRGGELPEIAIPAHRPFGLYVDIPPGGRFSSYVCEFEDRFGSVQFAVNVSTEEAKKTVLLLIPPSRLRAGKYTLVVRGLGPGGPGKKIEIARYPFVLDIL